MENIREGLDRKRDWALMEIATIILGIDPLLNTQSFLKAASLSWSSRKESVLWLFTLFIFYLKAAQLGGYFDPLQLGETSICVEWDSKLFGIL